MLEHSISEEILHHMINCGFSTTELSKIQVCLTQIKQKSGYPRKSFAINKRWCKELWVYTDKNNWRIVLQKIKNILGYSRTPIPSQLQTDAIFPNFQISFCTFSKTEVLYWWYVYHWWYPAAFQMVHQSMQAGIVQGQILS